MKKEGEFFYALKEKGHAFVMSVYDNTENFPKSELYGLSSQLRRAVVSIVLNFVEGHARFKTGYKLQFYEVAYGSTKECKYLMYLCFERKLITKQTYNAGINVLEEISKMLWSMIRPLQFEKKR